MTGRPAKDAGGVYPRVCGGTHLLRWFDYWLKGLSPRVRGNLLDTLGQLWVVRSIPACAGEP